MVLADITIADLHHTIQTAFGWTDSHLHRYVIHGKDYGIAYLGGIDFADDPAQVRLAVNCQLRQDAAMRLAELLQSQGLQNCRQ